MKVTLAKRALALALSWCVLATGTASAEPRYVGNKACAGCHIIETQDWQRSSHGKAMDLLTPGKRSKAKHNSGLKPYDDYRKDEYCWKCHTTGFKNESGFENMYSTPELAGIGCESCHGPGSDYIEIHKKKLLEFKRFETRAAGQTYASKGDKVCEKCHNTDSPFKPSVNTKYAFDLKSRLKSGT